MKSRTIRFSQRAQARVAELYRRKMNTTTDEAGRRWPVWVMVAGLLGSAFLYAMFGPPVSFLSYSPAGETGLKAFGVFTALYVVRWLIAWVIGQRDHDYRYYVLLQCASPLLISTFVLVTEKCR